MGVHRFWTCDAHLTFVCTEGRTEYSGSVRPWYPREQRWFRYLWNTYDEQIEKEPTKYQK